MSCQSCGEPVSKRNTSGFCRRSPECRRKAQAVADARYHAAHPEKAAERWAAYGPGYKQRRAELDRVRLADPEFRAARAATVQAFKARPENAERVRAYNRHGRATYMARTDRACLSPDGCGRLAKVGQLYCDEHGRIEARRSYHRGTARRRKAMAETQAWICPWCDRDLPPDLDQTHVDHIIPRASGLVIEEAWNLQLLHGRCNQEKSDKITIRAITLAAEHGLTLAA